ncbi:hypothetical protein GCM10027590_66090 [Nocardiopsis nanhaiensis]
MNVPREYLLDIHDAIQWTGLTQWRLYEWHRQHKITPWLRGKQRMFDMREIPERSHPHRHQYPKRIEPENRDEHQD